MGIRVPGDPGMFRLPDRPWNRPALWGHGKAQERIGNDLSVSIRHLRHIIPMDLLGLHSGVLEARRTVHRRHEQFRDD